MFKPILRQMEKLVNMSRKEESPYHSVPPKASIDGSSTDDTVIYSAAPNSANPFKWVICLLSFLLVVTNIIWAWHATSILTSVSTSISSPVLTQAQSADKYPPSRTIMQPIYQDTEFNEDGKNKERADGLWKGLFPNGNGVISLNISEAREHGLHDTAADPLIDGNALYIIAGFHTLHCVSVLRTALFHYRLGHTKQVAPWTHLVHCLDMLRQTLMCNMDTTLMWLNEPDDFADGQLHMCTDFWQLHEWASQHAG